VSEHLLRRLTEATGDELDVFLAQAARLAPDRSRPYRLADESPRERPLSFAQERVWFLEQLEPSGGAYHIWLATRVVGDLSIAALRESLRAVMARQEQLRATFHSSGGTLVQSTDRMPPPLSIVDVSGLPTAARVSRVASAVDEAIGGRFDMTTGPLFRVVLIREGAADHRLVCVLHHGIADAWSVRVLIREVGEAYRSLTAGRVPQFIPVPLQYADFASWQRRWLADGVAERQLSFWTETLHGAPEHLEFPTDFPRGLETPLLAGRTVFQLHAYGDLLRRFARRQRTTPFAVLLAAYYVLLARLAGQATVVVGVPVAGRNWTEVENLVGLFVNTLPLRGDIADNPRFLDLLDRTTRTIAAALANQDVPFEYLVERLQPARDRNRTPLFQTMLQFSEEAPVSIDLSGLRCETVDAVAAAAKFDFSCFVTSTTTGRLEGAIEYDARLFRADTMGQLAAAYATLIDGILSRPDQRISEFPLTTVHERDRLRRLGSLEGGHGNRAERLDRLFERQARTTPDLLAAVEGDRTMTYRELDEEANRLARGLVGRGLRPGGTAAVYLHRSLDLLVAILGVFKAGGTFLPLNPEEPPDRTRWMLADAGASLVLTHRQGVLDCAIESMTVGEGGRGQSTVPPAVERTPHGYAYIIYTSGSTGSPKAVCVTHANVSPLIEWSRSLLAITEGDRVLQQFAPNFDLSIFEVFVTLAAGARLVIPSDETMVEPRALVDFMHAHQVTILQGTPAHFQALLSAGRPLPDIGAVCLGGERFTTTLLAAVEARVSACCRIFNMYGPTETGILCALHEVDRTRPARYRSLISVPIGGPTAGARLYVVDAYGGLLPFGAAGELHVGGAGVATGYLRSPMLTAERYVPDPHGDGSRLYRTGDRVRWQPDNQLEFLGRIDQQVKIRGFRVEPGEVEAVLSRHPEVLEAAVVAHEADDGVDLIACVVPRSKRGSLVRELRRFLASVLPQYMVPSAFVVVDRLPRTSSGKIDRRALLSSGLRKQVSGRPASAARTETERRLLDLWRETLRRDDVGVDDNFFELGGHSLQAIRLMLRVGEMFYCDLSVRSLFDSPTVAGLARVLDARVPRDRVVSAAPSRRAIAARSADAELALGPQQEDWWHQEQLTGNVSPNTVQCGLRFQGPLDVVALKRSLDTLHCRHEALRTAFLPCDSGAVPIVSEAGAVRLPVMGVDLSALPPQNREAALVRVCQVDRGRAFDLTRGPVCRTTVVHLDPADWVVLFTTHHLVCDAWSINVLVTELSRLYSGFVNGESVELPRLLFQYLDFARWQREQLATAEFGEHLFYWTRQLAPPWPALFGSARSVDAGFESPYLAVRRRRPVVMGAKTVESVRAVARSAKCTVFSAVLATLKLALFARTHQPDLRVATLGANRTIAGCERVVGLFTNVLCVRTQVDPSSTVGDFLVAVHGRVRDAASHQELPFGTVAHALEAAAAGASGHLLEVALFWQPLASDTLRFPNVRVKLFRPPDDDSLFLIRSSAMQLVLDLVETPAELAGTVTYNGNRFSAEEIQSLLDDCERGALLALKEPAMRVSELCARLSMSM
jgi:amino acid adenylation domain-containing protein